jgi:hypothetical protein
MLELATCEASADVHHALLAVDIAALERDPLLRALRWAVLFCGHDVEHPKPLAGTAEDLVTRLA